MTSTSEAAKADTAYIEAGKTLRQAGHLMRELGVAVLRVRGDNGEVQGTISQDMLVRRIAAGGDPKTVTVGEVAPAAPARRRAPARPPGNGTRRGHHGPDPGGDLDWTETGPGPAWPWQARTPQGAEISAQRAGLVALRRLPDIVRDPLIGGFARRGGVGLLAISPVNDVVRHAG